MCKQIRAWLTVLFLAMMFMGCSTPSPILPTGAHRVPVNSEELISQYQERLKHEQQDRQNRTTMERQIEVLSRQVAQLRAYVTLLEMQQRETDQPHPKRVISAPVQPSPSTPRRRSSGRSVEGPNTPKAAVSGVEPSQPNHEEKVSQAESVDTGGNQPEAWGDTVIVPVGIREAMELHRRTIIFRVSQNTAATRFSPSPALMPYLTKAMKTAQCVQVRGYTDGEADTPGERRVATQRAEQARAYLVEHGLSPLHIDVQVNPIGGHIADNATEAGRAQNRRVEIEIMDVDPASVWPRWRSERMKS